MTTVLWGRDHVELGITAVETVDARHALALTRGFLPKHYEYVDPNEDIAAISVGARATLLVVADGHNGLQASETAVGMVLGRLGDDPPPADLDDDTLVDLFHAAGKAVVGATRLLDPPHRHSRTTLTVALIAGRRLQWAALGDSALITASAACGVELTQSRNHFVGNVLSRDHVVARLQRGVAELAEDTWVIAASDGFTNFITAPDPGAAVAATLAASGAAATPAEIAVALLDDAGRGGAGDNVTVAVAAP